MSIPPGGFAQANSAVLEYQADLVLREPRIRGQARSMKMDIVLVAMQARALWQLLFRKHAKLIRDPTSGAQHHRSVPDRFPAEAFTDDVNSAIGRIAHDAAFSSAAPVAVTPKGESQLAVCVLCKVRHADCEQRYFRFE